MRRGRKPSKKAVLNRLEEIFHSNPIDKRSFSIQSLEESSFVKVYHTQSDDPILKIHPLSEKYGLYYRDKGGEMSAGRFSSNLDDFEERIRNIKNSWI